MTWVLLGASAAEAQVDGSYKIAPKSYSNALIDLAVQAGISIGGVSACVGRSPGLSGRYSLTEALRRITAGAGCRFEIVDGHTVRMIAAPAGSSARTTVAATRPAPAERAAPMDNLAAPVSEMLVTSTKRFATVGRVPAAISVLSGEQLRTTGASDTASAVGQAAGVITTNLGPGRDKIMLRGLSDGAFTGRTRSTVGTYLDDVTLTYNAPDPDLRLADIEGVEIVRGPQGALYGGGSLTGIYRIVSRKPVLDELSGGLRGSVAWTQSGAPSQAVEGVINLPLLSGQAAARLVAYSDVQGGFVDDVSLRLSNVDQTRRNGGRLAVTMWPSDSWSMRFSAALQQIDTADTQYVSGVLGPRQRNNRVRETHRNNFSQAAITVNGSGDWGRFQSSSAYIRHDFESLYDASAALSLFGETTADLGVYDEHSRVKILFEDAFLTSPETGDLRWLVGVYGALRMERSPSRLSSSQPGGTLKSIYREQRTDTLHDLAIYGEVSHPVGWGWTAAVGARAFQKWLETESDVIAPAPGRSRGFVRAREFQGWSPKLSLQYDFASGDLFYLLASQGSRAGGFNSGGLNPPSPQRTQFEPDQLVNYEAGAKLRLAEGRIDLRSALFYAIWTDIQSDQFYSSGLAYTANVGDGRNLGFETEIAWRPMQHWSVQANALFSEPKITEVNPAFAARVSNGLPGVPDISMGAMAIYERPLAADLSLLLTGEANYIGRSRLTFDPLLSPRMGGYVTTKVSAQLSRGRWRAAAFISNLANAEGDTFAYGNPFSFGQVRQVTPQRPRTLAVTVGATF